MRRSAAACFIPNFKIQNFYKIDFKNSKLLIKKKSSKFHNNEYFITNDTKKFQPNKIRVFTPRVLLTEETDDNSTFLARLEYAHY